MVGNRVVGELNVPRGTNSLGLSFVPRGTTVRHVMFSRNYGRVIWLVTLSVLGKPCENNFSDL